MKSTPSRERGHPCPPKRAEARLAVVRYLSASRHKVSLLSRCALMAGRDARAPGSGRLRFDVDCAGGEPHGRRRHADTSAGLVRFEHGEAAPLISAPLRRLKG